MKYQVASNLDRNGMSLECMRDDGSLAIEIFYSDTEKTFTIETFSGPVNSKDLNIAMMIAEKRLPSKVDAPVESATRIIESLKAAALEINEATENRQTSEYLMAMAAWINDCDGYYKNTGRDNNYDILDVINDSIKAGLIYE